MKRLKQIGITVLISVLLAGSFSCNKNFSEINTDPNRTPIAMPEQLLAPAIHSVVTGNQTRALRLNNELMQDQVTAFDSREFQRYVIRPNESDYMWNRWYVQLTNFRNMYETAKDVDKDGDYRGYMGISLILDVWVSSMLTDMFGAVPYFNSNRGKEGIYLPKFDKQELIYEDMFRKLEKANEHLTAFGSRATQFTPTQQELDPLYNGDVMKWRKFGNSLYLRLLLRASGRAESGAIAKIREIVNSNPAKYPIFTSNDDSAVLRFTGTEPLVSAFYTYRPYDFNGSNGATEFFVYNLNMWNDPRRPKWITMTGGAYIGKTSGYPVGQAPDRRSYWLESLMNEPLLGNILNYPEVEFILAEAAVKGYIGNQAQVHYENGVKAALTFWGVAVPEDYTEQETVRWIESGDLYFKMQRIHVQKYYTLFFTDFQQWTEYRRTGHPILPKGTGLQNDGIMPTRFKYPVNVQSLNQENYTSAVAAMGGKDDMLTKVWWNRQD